MNLYHVTPCSYGKAITFNPRIPQNRASCEDSSTPRVCLSVSLRGAIKAACQHFCYGNPIYIYTPITNIDIYRPITDYNEDQLFFTNIVEDAEQTGEVWSLEPVTLILRKVIKYHKNINTIGLDSHKKQIWESVTSIEKVF